MLLVLFMTEFIFSSEERRVDILINNAGVMGLQERTLSEDGFEMHLAVNHLGE